MFQDCGGASHKINLTEVVASERGEEHLAIRCGGDAVRTGASWCIEYRHRARFGIEPATDAILPGEPEHLPAVKGGCVEVSVAPVLGEWEQLDRAGRRIDAGDRILSAFGDPGGTVGPTIHAVGRCIRPQHDQIRLPVLGSSRPSLPADCAVNQTVPSGAG